MWSKNTYPQCCSSCGSLREDYDGELTCRALNSITKIGTLPKKGRKCRQWSKIPKKNCFFCVQYNLEQGCQRKSETPSILWCKNYSLLPDNWRVICDWCGRINTLYGHREVTINNVTKKICKSCYNNMRLLKVWC
jgi:hypothetical protein